MHMDVFVFMVCVHGMPKEARRGHQILWLSACCFVSSGNQIGVSGRAASPLIPPVP